MKSTGNANVGLMRLGRFDYDRSAILFESHCVSSECLSGSRLDACKSIYWLNHTMKFWPLNSLIFSVKRKSAKMSGRSSSICCFWSE